MTKRKEDQPAIVPFGATQAGETRPRWWWVEPSVWTERMLATLDTGVKGGRWFSLIDKVYADSNLHAAWCQVAANKGAAGVDHVSVKQFMDRMEENLERLATLLREGTYRPQAVRRVEIPKPGTKETRPLGIPTVQDRVVQAAVRNVLEPIFEQGFASQSYGFRPGRGCSDALRRVEELLEAGHTHVVDADLKSYFDTIPHEKLLACVRRKVSDGRILSLLEAFLQQGIFDGLREWTPVKGSPQGAVISPLLSNIYLDGLDHQMSALGFEMVRYADDFVVLCRSAAEADRALQAIKEWTAEALLTLHPTKTRIVDAQKHGEGFDFLGYHFERGMRWPRKKSLAKLKDAIRAKTKRTAGHRLEAIIAQLNPTLRGWFAYFRHSHPTTFVPLDQWIRMRLRSVLRKRSRRPGRGRGRDHQRWPNAFFAQKGLYSLELAHTHACQSSLR